MYRNLKKASNVHKQGFLGVTLNSPGLNFVVRDYKFVVQDYMK